MKKRVGRGGRMLQDNNINITIAIINYSGLLKNNWQKIVQEIKDPATTSCKLCSF